jgi:hypothetical protein
VAFPVAVLAPSLAAAPAKTRSETFSFRSRVTGFTRETVEALQKRLARELGTDKAGTSCAQTTRLPGFFYLKPPVARTCGIDLISPALTYGAVTDSMKRTETEGPTGLLLLSWRQFVSLCCSGVCGRRDASCQRLITVAAGVACD